MILRKPVYVNHVDIWFLRSMDPLSRDPLKLRPLLKSLIKEFINYIDSVVVGTVVRIIFIYNIFSERFFVDI